MVLVVYEPADAQRPTGKTRIGWLSAVGERQLATMQLAEFLAIGLLAGTVAAVGAVGLAMVLSERVLGVPYHVNWLVPLGGLLIGGIGVAFAGLLGTRKAVSSPPLQTIRAVT
jgi:putative ABC transport system permease protein